MVGVQIILVLALLEYMVLGFNAGRARVKYDIKAPATTGHPMFERAYRIHYNTLEQLIVFVPSLLLFSYYVSARFAFILGLLFVIARAVYAVGYTRDPEQRAYGAGLTFLVNTVLVIGSLVGLLIAH
jgi:glutathione S-transferase